MTWNPRKRNYLIQRPSPAPPLLSILEDRELDIAVQHLIHVEGTIRKLLKEIKHYLDTIANLEKSDEKLSTNLSASSLVHINDEFCKLVENYHSVTTQVNKNVQELTSLTQKTFIEPLKKLRDEFILIESALIKREELVNIWKYSYNKIKKLEEKKDKTANHLVKLEKEKRSEEILSKELKSLHLKLLIEIKKFLEKRIDYVKPSVYALMMIQLNYYGNNTKLFTQLMPEINSSQRYDVSNEEYNSQIFNQIHRIKNLTIVKNN